MKHWNHYQAIFVRELFSYFNSPIAYIFIVVFVMLTGGLFMGQFFLAANDEMRYFFGILPVILCVFIPAITMRLWAEEKKGNTFELLLTFPMSARQLVVGKFAAAFLFYSLTLLATISIPLMLFMVGKPDPGPMIGGYLGALLMGAFFLSVGIFISGLCKDQIVAFVITMLVCFFFYLIGLDFFASLIDGWIPGLGSFLSANFGMTRHFLSFQKGVIDNKDLLYFIIMTVVFLVLNIFSIEDRMRPKAKLFFSVAIGICLAISMAFNALVNDIPLGRIDLTQDKIYTVTSSTRKILQSLRAPIQVKLYISPTDKMPTIFKTLEQDIVDQLEEIKILAKGKLDYKVIHMETTVQSEQQKKEEATQEKLQQKGIFPFQVQSIEQDEMGIRLIYSAISIAYKEKEEEIIPRITSMNLPNLEYELVSKIYRMTLPKKPVVALVAPYTEKAMDPQMLAILRQLAQLPPQYLDDHFQVLDAALHYEDYDVHRIRLTEKEPLPANLDTLIVVEPENLNERQRYEISRFLQQGGNVIIAAQKYEYKYNQTRDGVSISAQKNGTNIDQLLEPYGVTIDEKMLMDEKNMILSISGGRAMGPFEFAVPVKAPIHIVVPEENMKKDVSISGHLPSLFYVWGSALNMNKEKISDLKLKNTVLFTSSAKSWGVPFHPGPLQKEDVTRNASSYDGKQPLAVLLEGQFPDIFMDKSVPAWPKEKTETNATPAQPEPQTPLSPQPGKLLVVGCSKMFEEAFVEQGKALYFFINAVDALTLGGELINIRSHHVADRTIKALGKAEKLWYRILAILIIPIIVVILGALRAFLRQSEKEQYLKFLQMQAHGIAG